MAIFECGIAYGRLRWESSGYVAVCSREPQPRLSCRPHFRPWEGPALGRPQICGYGLEATPHRREELQSNRDPPTPPHAVLGSDGRGLVLDFSPPSRALGPPALHYATRTSLLPGGSDHWLLWTSWVLPDSGTIGCAGRVGSPRRPGGLQYGLELPASRVEAKSSPQGKLHSLIIGWTALHRSAEKGHSEVSAREA